MNINRIANTLNITRWQDTAQDRAVWKDVTNTVGKLPDPYIAWRQKTKEREATRAARRAAAAAAGQQEEGDEDDPEPLHPHPLP